MKKSITGHNHQKPAIIVINRSTLPLAEKIASLTKGKIYGFSPRVNKADVLINNITSTLNDLFCTATPIVAIMATGVIIRLLAKKITDKNNEPAVLSVASDGSSVIPLIGGHNGGNDLARHIASGIGGLAAITTAGDLAFGVALDEPPEGYELSNPEDVKLITAQLLNGVSVCLDGKAPWLLQSGLSFQKKGNISLKVTSQNILPQGNQLIYHPKTLVVGLGCERGVDPYDVIRLVKETLVNLNLSIKSLIAICSIDLKIDEPAFHAAGEYFSIPVRFFSAETLEKEYPRLHNPSDLVFRETGCHGVCEGACLAAVGKEGRLIQAKIKSNRITIAVACTPEPVSRVSFGHARGHLFIVGIGPGNKDWRSPEVNHMLEKASDLVGYSLYLDLLGTLANNKIRHDFSIGEEEERVRHAMLLAGEGRNVALVCSGDAGIYGMATLVFELLDNNQLSIAAQKIEISVAPGISALQAAAARAGAPLGHDFCTISLSDLLTPWHIIKKRIKAAAQAGFVIVFYNPASKKRRHQIIYARDELLCYRSYDTPVILASNLGRDGEVIRLIKLGDLCIGDVDMLTVVVICSSESRVVKTANGKSWVYTPRGYSSKTGNKIKADIKADNTS